MKPQITVGLIEFGTVAAYVIVFTFMWRAAAAWLAERDHPAGKAMAGVYS